MADKKQQNPSHDADEIAARFERIRRAHQSEVAEDYVEMIADLIAETGEARAVDLAQRFWSNSAHSKRNHSTSCS